MMSPLDLLPAHITIVEIAARCTCVKSPSGKPQHLPEGPSAAGHATRTLVSRTARACAGTRASAVLRRRSRRTLARLHDLARELLSRRRVCHSCWIASTSEGHLLPSACITREGTGCSASGRPGSAHEVLASRVIVVSFPKVGLSLFVTSSAVERQLFHGPRIPRGTGRLPKDLLISPGRFARRTLHAVWEQVPRACCLKGRTDDRNSADVWM